MIKKMAVAGATAFKIRTSWRLRPWVVLQKIPWNVQCRSTVNSVVENVSSLTLKQLATVIKPDTSTPLTMQSIIDFVCACYRYRITPLRTKDKTESLHANKTWLGSLKGKPTARLLEDQEQTASIRLSIPIVNGVRIKRSEVLKIFPTC